MDAGTLDLIICRQCALLTANGENEDHDGGTTRALMAYEHWDGNPGRFIIVPTGDDYYFSGDQCDGCGDRLAGDRTSATASPR